MANASTLTRAMPAIAAIRASVVLSLVEKIEHETGKADILLAGHGILRTQLQDPYAMVPLAPYVALFEEAATLAGDPMFGARLGTAFKPSDIGPIGVLFSLSATIRDAFERLSKHVRALQGATSSGTFEEDDHLVWSYKMLDPALWPRRQESEYTLAASCHLVRSCFGHNWKPREVHFEHAAPRDSSEIERLFRAPVLYEQSGNRLLITKEDADRVYRREDKNLTAVLERHLDDMLGQMDIPSTVSAKVSALIGIYLGHKPITRDAIAHELQLSTRTLQRRLSDEGTSLRSLIQEHRKTVMELHMASEGIGKKQTAQALGYADTTVFWRARKSWSKKTPL